jgi:hypothetical protein
LAQGGIHLDSCGNLIRQAHRHMDDGDFGKAECGDGFDAVYEMMNEVDPLAFPDIY